MLKQLRTQVIRVNLVWGGPNGVAKRRPVNPMNPNDPAYDWAVYDRTVQLRQANNGIKVVFSIIGTPPWANAAAGVNVVPKNALDLRAVRDRRGPPLQRDVQGPGRPRSLPPVRSGSPGTSRTTRPSCGRSTARSRASS